MALKIFTKISIHKKAVFENDICPTRLILFFQPHKYEQNEQMWEKSIGVIGLLGRQDLVCRILHDLGQGQRAKDRGQGTWDIEKAFPSWTL